MQLSILKTELFDSTQCDFWKNEVGDVFMTIAQLSEALGYLSRDGIEKIVERNSYLSELEFSVTDKLSATDGKQYETRIFTEDGIYEITMLSKTTKAKEFRSWVRNILKGLRKGNLAVVQASTESDKLKIQQQRAEAMLLNAKTRQVKLMLDVQRNTALSPASVELLHINAIEQLLDKTINHRPDVGGTHYTATQIGNELGIPANVVGKIANDHGIKTAEYGIVALDKARYSDKQVTTFRYNNKGRQRLIEIIKAT